MATTNDGRVPLGRLAEASYKEIPDGGWKEHTLYEVRVAWSRNNPVYTCLMYSGFLSEGQPAGYACLWSPTAHETPEWRALWYLEIVQDMGVDLR